MSLPPHVLNIPWSDAARAAAFAGWMHSISATQRLWPPSLRMASSDASFRRYFRVDTQDGSSRIIMDAPPEREECAPFIKVARLMREGGVLTPDIFAWEETLGFVLMSDLGMQTMMQRLHEEIAAPNGQGLSVGHHSNAGALPHRMYMLAIDTLVQLQGMAGSADNAACLPPYDEALLHRELQLFVEWYVAAHRAKSPLTPPRQAEWTALCNTLIAHNLSVPKVYVHRDFMPRNLMVSTPERLGVVDFQDAVHGPVTYDIASLVRDAFLSWDEDFVLDVVVRYWQSAKSAGLSFGANVDGNLDEDFAAFYKAVEWMGLQRHLKILGIFARLTLRDGKPQYLADTPRFIRYVRHTAGRYRALTPLLRFLDEIEGEQSTVIYSAGRL